MQACTFFGHRDCPTCLYEPIKKILMELIEKKGVKVFYIGTQGRFDQYGTPFIRKVWRRVPDDMQFQGGIDGCLAKQIM